MIEKFDSKDTCFYVDPPYPGSAKYYHRKVDIREVAETLKNIKGKAIVSYYDTKEVRDAFKRSDGWHFGHLDIPYSIQRAQYNNYDKKRELLITNF